MHSDGIQDPDGPELITIIDNGLIEIEPGMATARLYLVRTAARLP
ncbi:hypothetical protein [Arthrobacter hankyongi]|nr:hypothetical protein [Arthrobacter hankyongi]